MILEPNDFLKKSINSQLGDGWKVVNFTRKYYNDCRSHEYIIEIQSLNTIFYSTFWTDVDDTESFFADILEKTLSDKKSILEIINGSNFEDLVQLVSNGLCKKYEAGKFFEGVDSHEGWVGVDKILRDYIPSLNFSDYLSAYSYCIDNFRDYYIREYSGK